MHDTTLPLGPYAGDPRFQIVKVDGKDAIRTEHVTIIHAGRSYQVWPLDEPTAVIPAYAGRSLAEAIAYELGDPAKVGPTGMGGWLHTDGRVYAHDPATTGMRPAGVLRAGDIVDFPDLAEFEIIGPARAVTNKLGQRIMGYPVRKPDGATETFTYQHLDLVPVRFAR